MNPKRNMNEEIKFLGTLLILLNRCKITYNAYMLSGKLFLYAKILKDSNNLIKELLIQNSYLLPTDQSKNALAILHHIDVWGAIWDETFETTLPKLNTIFTFENNVKFPHIETSNLMDYYEELKLKDLLILSS